MAESTALLDSRLRMFVVLLPALALAVYIATEIADENYLVPWLVMGGVVVALVFAVLLRTVRVEAATLCLLLAGYLVGNRGFAELSPAKPLYPGELCMLIIFTCMLMRFALTRELPDLSGWIARTILIYCAVGAVRLVFDYQEYRLDAIRDSAMVYYSVYFFFGRELVQRTSSKALLEGCLKFALLALVPIAIVERFAPELIFNFTASGGFNPLFQKDDLLTTFAAVAVFILYTRPGMYRPNWIRIGLILFYLIFVVSGVGRASLAALAFGSVLLFVAGQKRFFIYPLIGLLLGLVLIATYAVGYRDSSDSAPSMFVEKLTSMVDVSGNQSYNSEYGEGKAMNNEFRRRLWESFVDDTNSVSPAFGRGFGYDFVSHFESTFQRGGWEGLRSAHNFFVTIYGRMGIAGLLVFLAITGQIIVGGLRAALMARAENYPLAELGYWCGVWAILVSSVVGVVLEGPVGAIVLWAFLGVAVQTLKVADSELASAREKSFELDPIPESQTRRPLTYGAA